MVDSLPAHTPYDGSSRLFSIGLRPLDLADWIEVDDRHAVHIAEKRRLYATIPALVFVEQADTRDAQREVLGLIAEHLARNGPRLFAAAGPQGVRAVTDSDLASIYADNPPEGAGGDPPPLLTASLLVQEDLILMRQSEAGWRLAAGSLCFPSSWSLREKFGKPLADIHAPVPAFGPGTRNAGLIGRMFDNLRVEQPVHRFNWSIQSGDALYHPLSNNQRSERATVRPARFPDLAAVARAFIRVERQTLRKLPVCGDILFTIRIHLDPLATLEKHPDRNNLALSFAEQLAALDEAQLDYKGLTADRERLVGRLKDIAASQRGPA